MSLKNRDNKNRWRSKTIGFRVSPEEYEQINRYVKLSGLTKQDDITRPLLQRSRNSGQSESIQSTARPACCCAERIAAH